MMKKMMIKK